MGPDTGVFSNVKFSFLRFAFQAMSNLIRNKKQTKQNKMTNEKQKAFCFDIFHLISPQLGIVYGWLLINLTIICDR